MVAFTVTHLTKKQPEIVAKMSDPCVRFTVLQNKEKEMMISNKMPSVNYTADGEMFIWTNEMERMAREYEAERELDYLESLVDDREEGE
jgi:hypothetical protein